MSNPTAEAIQTLSKLVTDVAKASQTNSEAIIALEKRLRKLEDAQKKIQAKGMMSEPLNIMDTQAGPYREPNRYMPRKAVEPKIPKIRSDRSSPYDASGLPRAE